MTTQSRAAAADDLNSGAAAADLFRVSLRADVLQHPRADRVARGVLLALAVAVVLTALSGSGTSTGAGRLGGDYPAFYGAGRIVLDGDVDHLYDIDRQKEAEEGLFGDQDALLSFGYPPHVALAYAPLAALPYRVSWLLHTAAMVACSVAALWLLRPMSAALRQAFLPLTALFLTFYPLFVGTFLGQNTGLSALLIAGSWRLAHDRRFVASGAVLGLLLFKPQYGVPLIGLQVLAGRWRVLLGAIPTAVATWVASALLMGPGWVSSWLDGISAFESIDRVDNQHNSLSVWQVMETLLGKGAAGASAIALAVSAVVGVALVVTWRRSDLAMAMAMAIPALLLIAPHSIYYDAGLVVLTGAIVLGRRPDALGAVLAVWLIGPAQALSERIGITPVGLIPLVALVGTWWLSRQPSAGADPAPPDRSRVAVGPTVAGQVASGG